MYLKGQLEIETRTTKTAKLRNRMNGKGWMQVSRGPCRDFVEPTGFQTESWRGLESRLAGLRMRSRPQHTQSREEESRRPGFIRFCKPFVSSFPSFDPSSLVSKQR